ncbi:MAG: GNAT family N-acetyltransferase [Thermoplasmatota archaeon]
MVYIRKFTKSDVNQISEIAQISLKESYDEELYIAIHNYWPEGFLVASLDSYIFGFISGVIVSKDTSRILMLAVRPSHRNKGIGSNLLQNFIEKSAQKGMKKITLEVRVSSEKAISFYRKKGFHPLGIIEDFYTDGESCVKMVKYL